MFLDIPLGTYVLKTKNTRNNTGTHTPIDESHDKGKFPVQRELSNQKNWEKLKRDFEEQFN